MNYYFGHPNALSKIINYRVLQFSFPNGYSVKISRNLEYPNSDYWKATLMHRGSEIHDTAVTYNGQYLATGETSSHLSSDEIEEYLTAVKALPMRFH